MAILHLRTLNPYVSDALEGLSAARGGTSAAVAAPRGDGPGVVAARSRSIGATLLRGASSFGMSGVNAHALLADVDASREEEEGKRGEAKQESLRPSWRRAAAWPAPLAGSLVRAALPFPRAPSLSSSSSSSLTLLDVSLARPDDAAYVSGCGGSLTPAPLSEVAAAAARCCLLANGDRLAPEGLALSPGLILLGLSLSGTGLLAAGDLGTLRAEVDAESGVVRVTAEQKAAAAASDARLGARRALRRRASPFLPLASEESITAFFLVPQAPRDSHSI